MKEILQNSTLYVLLFFCLFLGHGDEIRIPKESENYKKSNGFSSSKKPDFEQRIRLGIDNKILNRLDDSFNDQRVL
ncbi:hypothetical protein [Flagellimonas crocea]|uniref:hypothetical protein n=1 Tax=Flagellimonas crocea TaxID=3067311 RepID=UPI00296E6838|nr:hypothetical protein [Muricauda sp. DH64]